MRVKIDAGELSGNQPVAELVGPLADRLEHILIGDRHRLAVMRTGDALVIFAHRRAPASRRDDSFLIALGRDAGPETLARLLATLAVRHFARRGRVAGLYYWHGAWWLWNGRVPHAGRAAGQSARPAEATRIGELFA